MNPEPVFEPTDSQRAFFQSSGPFCLATGARRRVKLPSELQQQLDAWLQQWREEGFTVLDIPPEPEQETA